MNELASCFPHVLHCNNSSNKQQSSLQATGKRSVQEFELHKFIELLKIMLPDLFVTDLYITDSLTQPITLLHNVTGSVGDDPRNDTTYDDFEQ